MKDWLKEHWPLVVMIILVMLLLVPPIMRMSYRSTIVELVSGVKLDDYTMVRRTDPDQGIVCYVLYTIDNGATDISCMEIP